MRRNFYLPILFWLISLAAWTQPANNDCANAITLTPAIGNLPTFTDGTTTAATQSLAPCSGTTANDVWYKFVATKTAHRVVAQQNGMASSPIVQIFSGTCEAPVSLQCFSTFPAGGLVTGLTIGNTYLVRIYAATDVAAGVFRIAITSRPQNDECVDAIALTPAAVDASPNYIAASSIDATQSQPACNGQLITDDDVWFKFTATSNAHRINVRGFLQNAVGFEVYSGTCANKVLISNCSDYSNGNNPAFINLGGLTPASEYTFRVFSVFTTAASASNFEVAVTTTVAPDNDECAGAISIPVNGPTCQTSISSTLSNATRSKVALCGFTTSPNHLYRDVWFKFVATAKAHFISTTFQLQQTRDLTIFSGDCNNIVAIGCLTTSGVTEGIAIGSLTVGQTYFVRIGNVPFSAFNGFSICVLTPVFDDNDDCATAKEITSSGNANCNRVFGNNANASQSGLSCVSNTLTTTAYDQWYKFTANETQYRLRLASAQSVRVSMEVLGGSCGTFKPVAGGACTAVTSVNDTIREVKITGLTLGETYFVRVAGDRFLAGAYNLCLKAVIPPVNDDCGGAKELAVATDVSAITLTGTNLLDVSQSSPACSGTANDDLWYTFQATAANIGALTTFNFIDQHVLQVFTGACDNLVQVSCTQLPNNTSGRANFQLKNLSPGTRYRMRLHGNGNSATTGNGQFTQNIGIYELSPPANDACANAIVLTPAANNTCTAISGLTVDANNTRASCNDGNTRDVWFRFEATAASHFLQIWGVLYDPRIELLQGTCDNLTSVVCFNNFTPQIGRRQFNNLVPGTTYFIKVSSNEAFIEREGVFRICLTTPSVPPNDECAGAINLPVCSGPSCDAQGLFSTNLATQSRPTCAGSLVANDVWFKFSTDKEVTIAIDNFNATIRKEVFTGTCDILTSVLCTNLHINTLPKPLAMTQYFVRVYNNASGSASTEFNIKVYENSDIKINTTLDTVCLKSNSVLNPSFEFAFACPSGFTGSVTAGVALIANWRFPTTGTSDFFNACQTIGGNTVHIPTNLCFGTQEPRSGRGFVGLFAISGNNYREYIQGELSAPMEPGKKYLVSFYVSLAEYSNTAIDRMGIHFKVGSTAINSSGPLSFTPQVESTPGAMLTERKGWVNISGVLEPTEAFTHFIIGNFRDNASTNTTAVLDESLGIVGGTAPGCGSPGIQGYYFIDDVFVGEIDETASSQCATLPVTWLSFTATQVNADSKLTWRTTQEYNCSRYEVERSDDGILFERIGTVTCNNTTGNSTYTYLDVNPGSGTFYYRIRQVDIDGKFEYSAVQTVPFAASNQLIVYPNPASNVLNIGRLRSGSYVQLYDAAGRLIQQTRSNGTLVTFNTQMLPSGLYELVITDANGARTTKKVQIVK